LCLANIRYVVGGVCVVGDVHVVCVRSVDAGGVGVVDIHAVDYDVDYDVEYDVDVVYPGSVVDVGNDVDGIAGYDIGVVDTSVVVVGGAVPALISNVPDVVVGVSVDAVYAVVYVVVIVSCGFIARAAGVVVVVCVAGVVDCVVVRVIG